ncbi:MAG: HAMP domain-containing histidine kinase [Alphaproteobacteria bacterium]|jgi:two-component system, sensor histidine kinase RegB|uniref:histidine kinase n=1 Tax=Brevundimonas mediterranea TaxID=74329 RepID=A0A6G7ELH5_9CAUL|nr:MULTISPECIES: ATP-binding protein [Brevundimonas]MBU1271640.1 HAMP domain-containing histidine kinase [Alphaproteobacteria bacterium]OYX80099.1 MAG: two-component sensor histidine kinase [Brevundimonas sp. 32-68-21]EDX80614.1 ATPase, histidine kinase-, DNA gyrase B-, and HSP90-like domain protein [Brevundimonas sp. BAL3]KDP95479.1 histidine kinase [Brevundimonas sp. EAKA]MBA4330348.1 sensor histidine kinase [Brevundimonas sp.]
MTKTLQRLLGIGDWRETAVSQETANRRNLRLLIQLRWLAVAGQVATILLVHFVMGIRLPVFWLLIAPAGLALVNLVSVPLTQRRDAISDQELMLALLADVAALTWQLFLTGGAANPFVALYLLQVVLGAVLLAPVYAWSLIGVTSLCFAGLGVFNRPLNLPPDSEDALLSLYMQGSLICFLLMAVLLVLFMTRINDNLRARDAYVADVRQQATEQDHIVRMGLLASGAAHELGTPLASLSVILSDWRRMPMLKADADLKQDMDVMQAEVERCKAIVTGILMSAGEARGQAPMRTTMGRFLNEVVQGWSARDARVRVEVTAWTGPDPSVIADPALRQVFGVLFDNAVEAGARRIFVSPVVRDGQLEFAIRDNGPGFPATILERLGKPYNSTKDRPGAGLGLFLLVNVMRSLGGAVEASNPPAGGGEVRLILPIAALAPQEMSDD